MRKINYKGWNNSWEMSNGQIELILIADWGPRIVRFRTVGKQTILWEDTEQYGKTPDKKWFAYGGHRINIAPEGSMTCEPEVGECEVTVGDTWIKAEGPPLPGSQLSRGMRIKMPEAGNYITVTHQLRNCSPERKYVTIWPITFCLKDEVKGVSFAPFNSQQHYRYEFQYKKVIWWNKTSPNDPKFILGERYLIVKHAGGKDRIKVGTNCSEGWNAHLAYNCLLVKRFPFQKDAVYPDEGANVQFYIAKEALEIEETAPLKWLKPKETITFTENIYLFEDIKIDSVTELELIKLMDKILPQTKVPVNEDEKQ